MKSMTSFRISRPHIAASVLAVTVTFGAANTTDPKVPPGTAHQDRVPLAVLTTGFDYTQPAIAARLARDGEGEIVGWDVPGNDRFPYAATGDTELIAAIAALMPEDAPVSLLPVKVDPVDPTSLARGLAFVARTPARTVLVLMWTSESATWEGFAKAATHFSNMRIVGRGCPDVPVSKEEHVYPRDLGLPNVVTTASSSGDPSAQLQAYVAALPCRRL
jgi:hypothetical protein